MKNKYVKVAHISEGKFRYLVKCFSLDLTASRTAKLCNISRNTTNVYYQRIRQRIFSLQNARQEGKKFFGEFELDESYFGPKRIRGKRGRGAAGKTPVFGILERHGHVHVEVVKNCSKEQLMPIIEGKILEGSTIHTDGWKAYDGLIINGYDHYRVFHSKDEFARGKCHVNGIESFWSFCKRRLAKFNGLTDHKFLLHLTETQWRFNHRDDSIYKILLNTFRKNPL